MVVCNWLIQVVISWQFNYWYQRWFAIFSCVDVAESNLPKIGWFSPQNDQALVHDCQDDGEGAAAKGHAALLKFVFQQILNTCPVPHRKAAGTLSEEVTLSEELEGIIRGLAENGAAACYPWDALRILLAAKLEKVLADFWREAPDLKLREGETFGAAVEPLTRSLLEPRREGRWPSAASRCGSSLWVPSGVENLCGIGMILV
ncbi:unnamed protein product [Cladocopium goreaui]|uniref:Serine/threonine-protein phosphatase 4 regulatory subunit 2 n=1 Tax=Cladocopium goreaui TaxID=2562237 RepID=A0A9P1BPJ2_9DINO|nr:unnamed protein product [Cladocopium goreaui]